MTADRAPRITPQADGCATSDDDPLEQREPKACDACPRPPTRRAEASRPCRPAPQPRSSNQLSAAAAGSTLVRGASPLYCQQKSSVLTGEMIKKGLSRASQCDGHLAGRLAPPPSCV
ncbi:hypothetical protein NDU88_005123 [Pleurodeles waltl]|uniref:Uncharacterized protein n=1 Tax=Pleurodeles waltl TaxID=8319 RepID=A0AAV7QGY1_PLEWA|nr:hypothetical protein NDU88_005123 [Pleurodeles waltl]